MMVHYLTVEQVLRINAKVLGQEDPALRDRNTLESAIARPMASAFGEDAYPTIPEKAAALLHSLVLNHPFIDANKRTATLAMIAFLALNGLQPSWSVSIAIAFITEVAERKHSVPDIARWLEGNTTVFPTT